MSKSRFCRQCGVPIVLGKLCQACTLDRRVEKSINNELLKHFTKKVEIPKLIQCWFCENEFYKVTKPINIPTYAAQCYYGNICCSHCLSGFYADKLRKAYVYQHSMPLMAFFLELERLKSEVDKDLDLVEKAFNENLEIKGNTMLFIHYENISVLGRPYVKLKFITSGISAAMNGASNFKLVKECVDY